ncbi:Na+-driven multidrug efflux pump [Xylanibacter ruminicola]|uniref:Na+-driven multidrug efflux pump n=1 Tax=Xylanibacter ruminicola TaxID=839 RepID=A0A1H4DS06_XYLRU|nr:hypothetical protein [Xylanibacter ruminicola]SEA75356.1 Na+-driven multidrug efflux pump [Xylanibacter ruminicola]
MSDQSDNKTIARNSILLYARMLLSIIVSIYTSRVVLQTLGVSDYGVYNVVGGVVAMFSFLNSAMAGATSRFFTFEMGKNDIGNLIKTFSSAIIIHIGLAVVVFIIAETFGLWLLCNKLVIPEERMVAAHVVYQCSIVGMFLTFTQVPYNAAIISHEKMDVYAYVELLHVFLKLGIVYLLLIGNVDKLVLYSILVLSVNVIIAMTYRFYCLKNFIETKFKFLCDKAILKPMLDFFWWNAFSGCGYSLRVYGSNIVLNTFVGTIVNAAGGIAATVQGIIIGFIGNVVTAVRPQIIKNYSSGNINRMKTLTESSIRLNMYLAALVITPIFVDAEYIFQLWLGQIPKYSIEFCRLLLFGIFMTCVSQVVTIGLHATGNIKLPSVLTGIIDFSTPFVIFICMYVYKNPVFAYAIIVLCQLASCSIDIFLLHRNIQEFNSWKILWDYAKAVIVFSVASAFAYSQFGMSSDLFTFAWMSFIEWIIISLLFFFLVFSNEERLFMLGTINKVIRKIQKH